LVLVFLFKPNNERILLHMSWSFSSSAKHISSPNKRPWGPGGIVTS
jgi:hypothetical protein